MADPIAPAAPVQQDAKAIAGNIIKGITDKSNGTKPADPRQNGQQPTPPADPNAGKEKYAVDGREIWLTPDQARAYVQKGISFEPKVSQLANLQHETNQFLKTLANDPMKILTDKRIGLTPEAVMSKIFSSGHISDEMKESAGKWYYENVVAPMKMTPEERKLLELQKENDKYKTKEQMVNDLRIIEENKAKVFAAMNQIKANIAEAMKDSGLPDNNTPLGAEMARMVADVMRVSSKNGQSITPKQAIEHVKKRIKEVQSAWYDNLDEEQLVAELGEKNAEKVKKYFLKLVKEADKKSTNTPRTNSRVGERKVITPDDMHDYLEELKKKG